MPDFKFDPPLILRGHIIVATLDDAAAFTRSLNPRLPKTRDDVLRWLEYAQNDDQRSKAANMFRIWAQSEGVLLMRK